MNGPKLRDDLVRVGAVASAHGIRGQVKLRSFTDNPEDIFAYSPLTDKAGTGCFRLKREGSKPPFYIVSIEGVADRNSAEMLRGTELYAPAQDVAPPEDGQWFYDDLIGLEVRLENGSAYGKVTGVYDFGAGDIVEIVKTDGSEEMLPFDERFVGDIELEKGYLVVFPPEYLETPKPGASQEPEA